jgi:hypothetical protein
MFCVPESDRSVKIPSIILLGHGNAVLGPETENPFYGEKYG